jgi:ATP-dependent helicase HrpA
MTDVVPASSAELHARLASVGLRDAHRLGRRLDDASRQRDPKRRADELQRLTRDIDEAEHRAARRLGSVPAVKYPQDLPVSQRRDDIAGALREQQVVVVAGETGSGKTTQLPKICLELGRGVRGMIGHTQPRRIAARATAERVAEELGSEVGETVGYTVRFTDRVSDDTLIKVMTDGVLLAEIQHDRLLRRYDTIIVDEAHERSLTIDFLLGYLKRLLPRRPDLKVIVTSATIDHQLFSRHFDDAPVNEVTGRTYPVEVRYRPPGDTTATSANDDPDEAAQGDVDPIAAIGTAVQELWREGPGDVLVFLPGEREIRDAAEALGDLLPDTAEILPLYARLSSAEQHRVFAPHTGSRVVLSTNVAETSLTVPGIRYVVDSGLARISRYSLRTKVQRLPIEPVSQASANQRAGRCGRLADGICIRLYSEQDYESRPAYTEPEILRTSLAAVLLRMASLGLGDVEQFPFVNPPDARSVRAGVALLHELGAFDPAERDADRRITATGRMLARLPVDPQLGRMLVEADLNGSLREAIVIVAALSIQDPRERPSDNRQAADEQHARFADPTSDFLAWLNLWRYLQDQQRELSSSAFRRMCRAEFLHYLRVREWQDLHGQLVRVTKDAGMTPNDVPASSQQLHTSLLTGLLSHIGIKEGDKREYLGARGTRFAIAPGSSLSRAQPRWVVAAELVETSRLWARTVARIDPEWVEPLAGPLVVRTYSEPHWEARRGSVVAYERVTLYGLPLVTRRKVAYGSVDPELSRDEFIRRALVEGDWRTHHGFLAANLRLLEQAGEIEHRVRRRDLVVDDEALFAFYDARIPPEVVSARHFDSWWKAERRRNPELLTLTPDALAPTGVDLEQVEHEFPQSWHSGDIALPVSYRYEPGSEADGVTVEVPLAVLNRVPSAQLQWLVPGLREELVAGLIKTLPKVLRRSFVPATSTARQVLERVVPGEEPLLDALERGLRRLTGVVVPRDAWHPERLPAHLRPHVRVVDEAGQPVATGDDVDALRSQLRPQLRASIAAVADGIEREGLTTWDLGELPRTVERQQPGGAVRGWPALVDTGSSVAVRVLDSEPVQQEAMWRGTRRLLLLNLPSPRRTADRGLDNRARLALARAPHPSLAALLDDCAGCAVEALMAEHGGPAWDEAAFGRLLARVRQGYDAALGAVVAQVVRVLSAARDVDAALARPAPPAAVAAVADVRTQLADLVHPGFVTETGAARLADLTRYLAAAARRLEQASLDPARDRARMAEVSYVREQYQARLAALDSGRPLPPALEDVRWMIEELRVSLFAQALGTRVPVSEKRVLQALDAA